MAQEKPINNSQGELQREGITSVTVGGFKSINTEQSIEIRPLTILAGANSSGKSSIVQPLLLLKQTLEASYDPGALLLNGPNVKFTSVDQLLSREGEEVEKGTFFVAIDGRDDSVGLMTVFTRSKNKGRGFEVKETTYKSDKGLLKFYADMPVDKLQEVTSAIYKDEKTKIPEEIEIVRNRCFLSLTRKFGSGITIPASMISEMMLSEYILGIIHLPGLRGNPERAYPITAVGSAFPGTFENYAASVIEQWQRDANTNKLEQFNSDMKRLGLAERMIAELINDAQVELLINRFPRSNKDDMVNIADVGFGVSQVLPVVVALHAANPDQLVYIEQPEIHLHPRAQFAMAEVLAGAAIAGKRLVVETHSSLLLLGIQALVAEKKLSPELVKLHWFTQQEDGSTQVTSADLDEAGAYGDWPEDFDKVILNSESRYIDAAEARLMGE